MSRSVHSVKLNPYHSSQLSSLSYSLGDVVFDQDNQTLRVMDGASYGGNILANQAWTQTYINNVFSQAIVTFGNTTNYSSIGQGAYAVKISGGLLIAKDTGMTGALTVTGNATFNGNLNATITTQAQPNITSLGTLQGLTSSGAVSITNNTATTQLGTGALTVSGGASIAGNLYVGGNLVLTGTELVINAPTFKGTTTISGSTSPSTVLFTITNGALTPVTTFQIDSANGNTTIAGTLGVTGTITGSLTGNASTATKLAATKNINSVAFDGSADITVTAAASTLSGTVLNSTVVTSSLTSVGTLSNLTVSGKAIIGGVNIKGFAIAMGVAFG